jgi:hypothetical protein
VKDWTIPSRSIRHKSSREKFTEPSVELPFVPVACTLGRNTRQQRQMLGTKVALAPTEGMQILQGLGIRPCGIEENRGTIRKRCDMVVVSRPVGISPSLDPQHAITSDQKRPTQGPMGTSGLQMGTSIVVLATVVAVVLWGLWLFFDIVLGVVY